MPAAVPAMERPSTREPAGWTAEAVGERLVAEFRAFPFTGFRSPRPGVLEPMGAGDLDATRPTLISLSALYLADPERPHLRTHTLAWARAKAGVGNSIAQTCRDFGWDRSRLDDNRRLGCARMAAALNAAGVPLLALPLRHPVWWD